MRLDKFLANNKLGTRSEIKKSLKKGSCTINGVLVKCADYKVQDEDEIIFDGKIVINKINQNIYILMNKPKGVVTATKDNFDKTVIDILGENGTTDLFPVGRLDKDTTGLLIITNDGDFAHSTLSPKKHVPKKYHVELDGDLPKSIYTEFLKGVKLNDVERAKPAEIEILDSRHCNVIITEGKYHQIKRMFHRFGLEVLELSRISFGNLILDENLDQGDYRFLDTDEVEKILEKK